MTLQTTGTPAAKLNNRVAELKKLWEKRKMAQHGWYRMIQLYNDLEQDGMESVIGNDPRTSYNMAKHLLKPNKWRFNSDKTGMLDEEIQAAEIIDLMVTREVRVVRDSYRGRMTGDFFERMSGLFLTSGWCCLTMVPTHPRWTISAWNPTSVYPNYDQDGILVEIARQYTVSKEAAVSLIVQNGWLTPEFPFDKSTVTVSMLWIQVPFEGAYMGVTLDNNLVRPLGPTPFPVIPIYMTPAGGLPDDGTLVDDTWRAEIGQSFIASSQALQKNYDRTMTYMQQMLRDTANPVWVETAYEGDGVLTEERLYGRGAVFTVGGRDSIYAIRPDSNMDMRPHSFDLRNQIHRGSFPDTSFGSASDQVSAFLMSQATASTKQLLDPFKEELENAFGWCATNNINLISSGGGKLLGVKMPEAPDGYSTKFDYDIEIPGDFIQRANASRLLNPQFKLSSETLLEVMFPEVEDPAIEFNRKATEDAMNTEIAMQIKNIQEFRKASIDAEAAGAHEFASLLNRVIAQLEATLAGSPDQLAEQTLRDQVAAVEQ